MITEASDFLFKIRSDGGIEVDSIHPCEMGEMLPKSTEQGRGGKAVIQFSPSSGTPGSLGNPESSVRE